MKSRGIIVVTGASRGIGAAIAIELSQRGFPVACLSRKGFGIEDRKAEAPNLFPYACDITDYAGLTSTLARIAQEHGPIAGLVNNAGIHLNGRSRSFSTADFNAVLETNTTALFHACREVYPYLELNNGGVIVNIGSFYDKLGVPWNTAYCASKAAVAAITRCLAVEWAPKNIRVMNVAPGYIETDINREALKLDNMQSYLKRRIPRGEVGQPEDIARAVAALFAEEITFLTGETLYLDGGHGIAH